MSVTKVMYKNGNEYNNGFGIRNHVSYEKVMGGENETEVNSNGDLMVGNNTCHVSKHEFRNAALSMPITNERRVLVIYTGGTIGMVKNNKGVLAPVKGLFETLIRRFPQLHDEKYCKTRFHDDPVSQDTYLILPEVNGVQERIFYRIFEYDQLLDSSNMTAEQWIKIARDIKRYYEEYDGFVILHGTDTLSYTASALSFVLEDLGKCVILTGAQISIFEPRSDGSDNFVSALLIAGIYNIPEVTVFFGRKLFRGNRTQKVSAKNFFAFDSPNLDPLVTVGIEMEVNSMAIFRPSSIAKCHLHDRLSDNVGIIRIFPSINAATLRAFFQPPIEGVVIETFGSGNIPSNRPDLLHEIAAAVRRGVIVINITQCTNGSVAPLYETGRHITKCGVIPGFDLTPEAALTKLSYVLTKDEWDLPKKIEMMSTNLRGELSGTQCLKSLKFQDSSLIDALGSCLNVTSPKHLAEVTNRVLTALLFHAIENGDQETIEKLQGMGADINHTNVDGKTPLHEAVNKGNTELVEYLLLQGANVHFKTRSGKSPLMTAVQKDDSNAISTLRRCGAHLTQCDNKSVAEQMSLAARCDNVTRLESLRLAGADLNEADDLKQTPLHKAVICNHIDVVSYLLKHNVDTTQIDYMTFTAAQYAQRLNHGEIYSMLSNYINNTSPSNNYTTS